MPSTPFASSCHQAIGSWRLHPGHAMSLRPRQTAVLRGLLGYSEFLVAGRGRVLSPLESLRS